MVQPDISVSERVGMGYLSTTFTDPTDYSIIYRKWIFGDGVIVEGEGLSSINHTYYAAGTYTVTLIAQTSTDQYSVIKEELVVVNEVKPVPNFIIAQSFDSDTGEYWRFYFDQYFHLTFEDNLNIYRSKDKIAEPGKWLFIDFHRQTGKMSVGSFSYYIKEIEVIRFNNMNPVSFSDSKTDVLYNSTMQIDELYIWSTEKDTKTYYVNNRGRAGYLESLQ